MATVGHDEMDSRRVAQPMIALGVGFVLRGFCCFGGAFILLNLAGGRIFPGWDANLTWIDLRFLRPALRETLLASTAALSLAYALVPELSKRWRRALVAVLLVLAMAALQNSWQFYALRAGGKFAAAAPVPLSLPLAVLLLLLLVEVAGSLRQGAAMFPAAAAGVRPGERRLGVALVAGAWAFLFPLLQMYSLGRIDYRRPVDAVVVFGAKVYANGRLSDALADRLRTACGLYRSGLAKTLILSGGPGDGAITEPEAMKREAVRDGVGEEAIVLDAAGLDTAATVRNTLAIAGAQGIRSVILVSHFYHLPRAKMAFERAGLEAFTVPARESYILTKMPVFILREVFAYWYYYFRVE